MGSHQPKIKFSLLLISMIFLLAPASLASNRVLFTQGMVNHGGNLKAGYLLVNETRLYVDHTTRVMDQREMPVPLSELKPKKWVYLEIEKDPKQQTLHAKKIYLLPHYIKQDQKRRFGFMK